MDLKTFLRTSYTSYHTVKNCIDILEQNGFSRLQLQDGWTLKQGGKYYVTQNSSSIFAFTIGDNFAFNIAASHTDSPSLKIKGHSLIDSPEGKRINVEKYGGPILYSFLDTPLVIAGRVIVEKDGALSEELIKSDYNVVVPSIAIHHNPDVNNGTPLNVQSDLLPLVGDLDDLYSSLTTEKVVDSDLFVVPDVEGFYSGKNNEFFSSPRIDNLTSVYSSVMALVSSRPQSIGIIACFDNEEVGSQTKQGANSVLLTIILKKITRGLGKSEDDFISACEKGMILSIDNAHAIHPAHPEKFDPKEKVVLNGGIVIKHHVNYSTDGMSSAKIKKILTDAGIQYQDYFNRSDLRCGSTIGLMASANLAMSACDVGLAQLAMHSAVETVGNNDLTKMTDFVKAFLTATL